MSIEQKSLPELIGSRTSLEARLSNAKSVVENIASPGFTTKSALRLDDTSNLDHYIDNLDRVTAVQERVSSVAIPKFQLQLSEINEQIETLAIASQSRLTELREKYQRIQSRIETGLPVSRQLLEPISIEIQKLEEFITTGKAKAPTEEKQVPAEPEIQPAKVSVEEKPEYTFNEATKMYEVVLPDGQIYTTKGEKKAKAVGRLANRYVNIDELARLLGGPRVSDPRSNAGVWVDQVRKDKQLSEKKWAVDFKLPLPEVKTRTAKGLYGLKKIEESVDFNNINRLIRNGIITDPEVIEKAKEYAKTVGGTIDFDSSQEETGEKIEFSQLDKATLARLILNRSRIEIPITIDSKLSKFVLTLRQEEIEACKNLIGVSEELTNGSVEKAREEVLTKVEKLFKSKNAENLITKHEGDLGGVLLALFALDRIVLKSHLFEFLSSGTNSEKFSHDVYEWVRDVIRTHEKIAKTITPQMQFFKVGEELGKPENKFAELTISDVFETKNLGSKEKELVAMLVEGFKLESAFGSEEWEQSVWPEDHTRSILSAIISRLKKKLKPHWKIINANPERSTAGGLFYLEYIGEEQAVKVETGKGSDYTSIILIEQ